MRGRPRIAKAHYDARHGWEYLNHAGEWHSCPPPFSTHEQAIAYALDRLRANADSPYSVIVDARAALEWAGNLSRTDGADSATGKGQDTQTHPQEKRR
jgi:hypothetical protein